MSKTILKPCPFCGGLPTLKQLIYAGNKKDKFYYVCENPKCSCQPMTYAHILKAVVTRAWNRRKI